MEREKEDSAVLRCRVRKNDILFGCKRHLEDKAKASGFQGQRPEHFEAKATEFCPRCVLEDKDSPRGPHP